MSTYRERCDEARPDVAPGESYTVPNPTSGRSWVDDDGVAWRLRGGALSPRHARRLLSEPDVRVMHVYDGAVHDHPPEDLPGLVADLKEFWNGEADPHAELYVYEFRTAERARMAMVDESC